MVRERKREKEKEVMREKGKTRKGYREREGGECRGRVGGGGV